VHSANWEGALFFRKGNSMHRLISTSGPSFAILPIWARQGKRVGYSLADNNLLVVKIDENCSFVPFFKSGQMVIETTGVIVGGPFPGERFVSEVNNDGVGKFDPIDEPARVRARC